MGYTTTFEGTLKFDRPVTDVLKDYINKFSEMRHMKRDNGVIMETCPHWKCLGFNGYLGVEGEFFVGDDRYSAAGIVNGNTPSVKMKGC